MALFLMQSSKHFLPIVCSDIYILAYANEQQEVPHIANSIDRVELSRRWSFGRGSICICRHYCCCMMCPNCWCDGDVDNLASDCDRGLGMRGDGSRGNELV
eukprot:scaffold130081_cov74-Cyclotella_meneghiniana.AAC.2